MTVRRRRGRSLLEESEAGEVGHDSPDFVAELIDVGTHSPTDSFDEPLSAFVVEFGPHDDCAAGQDVARRFDGVVHHEVAVEFDDSEIGSKPNARADVVHLERTFGCHDEEVYVGRTLRMASLEVRPRRRSTTLTA